MEFSDLLPQGLRNYSRAPALARLHELYARLDAAQAAFKAAFTEFSRNSTGNDTPGLRCPEACGSCCEGFVPDVLPLEAEYLAAWLLRTQQEPIILPETETPPCPFYDGSEGGAHCSVYPARPLICRLFAFSASRDREGSPAFSLCRRMPEIAGIEGRSWSADRLLALSGGKPPIMAEYATELIGLAPQDAEQRELIVKALASALAKLGLELRYAREEAGELALVLRARGLTKGRDGEPEPDAPEPRAA